MTQASDSVGWYNAGGSSSQDQDGSAYGVLEEKVDDVEADKISTTAFGQSAYAPAISGDKSFSTATLNVESENGLPGDHSQWSQIQTPPQNFNWQGSDARSSFGSEYNFTVEKFIENPANIIEADIVSDWPYSDFEDDPAGGRTYNLQDAMRQLDENQPFNPGLGYRSMELRLTASRDNTTSFENRIDANSTIEQGLWPSILDANLPLEPRPRRSMRRPNVPATRPHAQPKSHPCDRCPSAFGRAGDLRRHYRVHFPDRHTFHCRVEGCNRNGQRGFYRRDKFRDHQRHAHGFGSESELVLLEGV